MKELILGGARSGKSRLAETRALESGMQVHYIATATAGDEEMSRRIRHHQSRRPPDWVLVEAPLMLASSLQQHAAANRCLVVDCLTLWLSNLLDPQAAGLGRPDEELLAQQRAALLTLLPQLPGRIILVSNEVGMGIVPMGEGARRFCDEAGRLHQDLAAICERVTLVVAGLPYSMKGA